MICTPNVPPAVRNWAVCERRIAWMSGKLHSLERGEPQGFVEALRLRAAGRPGYSPEETEGKTKTPDLQNQTLFRIAQPDRKHPAAEALLLSFPGRAAAGTGRLNPEMAEAQVPRERNFETITHVAPDGKGICSVLTEGSHPLTPLDLLCRGFGVTA